MKLSKQQRAILKEKFQGRCAYCGCELGERWHADHFEPVRRNWGEWAKKEPMLKPENDRLENFMPSCAPCNLSKHSMTLEQWRGWLTGHINSLNQYHPIYRLAKAYGLVFETGNPVVFHFEKQNIMSEWTDWKSGACPIEPNAMVQYRLRSGGEFKYPAGGLTWHHNTGPADIIAYRIIKEGE